MKRYLLTFFVFLSIITLGQTGVITNYAGTGISGYTGDNGPATSAKILLPYRGRLDAAGNYYFVQADSHKVRKIATDGTITTVAGNGSAGFSGDNGPALSASLNKPADVLADLSGNLYIADLFNHRIRKIDVVTGIITTIAGNGNNADTGDGNLATNAALSFPNILAIDKNDNLFVCNGSRIRRIDNSGTISTYTMIHAQGIFIDTFNIIYHIANEQIWKQGNLIAGTGSSIGSITDNVQATLSTMDPVDIAVDNYGNVFFADQSNDRIRRVDASGIVTTVAGGGIGFTDGEPATQAQLTKPGGVALDSCGNIYISAWSYNIRKVTYASCNALNVPPASRALSFTLSPNPATSQITITSSTKLKSIIVTNTVGAVVKSIVCGDEKEMVDIGELSSGMYFVKVVDVNGGVSVEKVVKL